MDFTTFGPHFWKNRTDRAVCWSGLPSPRGALPKTKGLLFGRSFFGLLGREHSGEVLRVYRDRRSKQVRTNLWKMMTEQIWRGEKRNIVLTRFYSHLCKMDRVRPKLIIVFSFIFVNSSGMQPRSFMDMIRVSKFISLTSTP